MTIDKLSPDEIKGLLGQMKSEGTTMSKSSLSKVEKEAVTELLTVSLGGSSAVLSALFSEQVTVAAPKLSVKHKDGLFENMQSPFFVVLGEYTGDIKGMQIVAVSKSDVEILVKKIDGESQAEDMEKQFGLIQEVIEQMFGSVSQSMATVLEQEVTHSLSGMDVVNQQEDFPISKFTQEEWFVEALFQVKISSQKTIDFQLCIPVQLAKQIVGILTDSTNEDGPEETHEMEYQSTNQSTNKASNSNSAPNIQSVQFSSFDETTSVSAEPNNLNMLLDIPLQVTVELGRTKRMVKEILSLSQGSIIELDKLAGEPVDILVNNKLIAVGEVVVIDENFGVRVTDILSTADRISKLR
ncbi:flagellar motor switch phosphatase FliY [Planococcus sp. YIM B11945]|uniref:flagellar motor switch phosphatase FliY n=1 Tax=Planococcus sp. YIM B11945 TaxID=3435410 RepID=UPI003D7EFB68